MKIQPIDFLISDEPAKPPIVVKSRLKRLFERQFLRNSAEKVMEEQVHVNKEENVNGSVAAGVEFEPSSVCLTKMVTNFIEGGNERQTYGGRNCCNCFNGNCSDSSEEELDCSDACEILKSLVLCTSVYERNLLADTARIVDKNKICKHKDDFVKKIVIDGLLALGYDASICKSRWEKSPSCSSGEYEYMDVVVSGERLLIDIDFRSEFEIARSTKSYMSLLQIIPYIFVGKVDRLQKIITVVSEAVKQSLKKKGMPIPPWRKADYFKAKWLSPYSRITPVLASREIDSIKERASVRNGMEGFGLRRGKKNSVQDFELGESVFALSSGSSVEEEKITAGNEWKPALEIKPKSLRIGVKMVTGLASVFADGP